MKHALYLTLKFPKYPSSDTISPLTNRSLGCIVFIHYRHAVHFTNV